VVGDGAGADERARRLQAAGARVERLSRAEYRSELCRGAFVVVANGDDDAHNGQVARDARAAGCLAYAHDQPALSDFAMPALIRRGPLAVAISTDAVAPALSRRLREQLEALFETAGDRLTDLIDRMERLRAELPRGRARAEALYRLASRLSIAGTVDIDDDPT
jgi:siroheme synthase-like protein